MQAWNHQTAKMNNNRGRNEQKIFKTRRKSQDCKTKTLLTNNRNENNLPKFFSN